MANSEDVVWMACESHLRRFGHVANCAPCLAVTLDYVRAEVRELRRDRARLEDLAGRRAVVLAFFRSVIHCREPWTDKCQLEYDAAMGGGEG